MTINRAKELEAANVAVNKALNRLIEEGHEDQDLSNAMLAYALSIMSQHHGRVRAWLAVSPARAIASVRWLKPFRGRTDAPFQSEPGEHGCTAARTRSRGTPGVSRSLEPSRMRTGRVVPLAWPHFWNLISDQPYE
jgi:hypothetical protein